MTGHGIRVLLLLTAAALADDAKPLPLRRSVILPSGGDYFVEGRQEIRWGQELSVQKGTRIVGQGAGATLVVRGALQVRGIDKQDVVFEKLTIEVAERCERVHMETVRLTDCAIRTPAGKACHARVHLEEAVLDGTRIDLRLAKGEVTILNSRTKGPVKLVAEAAAGRKAAVKVLLNACNIDRTFLAQGLPSLVVRACAIYGRSVEFRDCASLTFDANVVKCPSILFEQSQPGRFKQTKLQKSDFHGTKLVFKAPRAGAKKDRIPVDKCWFEGLTKKDKILDLYIRAGHNDETSGVFLVFRKINKRELKLGGKVTKPAR